MQNLRIATWNIKNNYFNISKTELKAASIVQLLKEEKVDILTLQEVNPLLARRIKEKLCDLKDNYKITTNYTKITNSIKNLRIEDNMIISRLVAEKTATLNLPWIPKGLKKFKFFELQKYDMKMTVFSDNLIVNTTYLNHSSTELGKQQMDNINNWLHIEKETEQKEIILTGTLNRKPNEENMIYMAEQLANNGLKIIDNPNNTYIGQTDNQPIDYIIIPDNWEVKSINTLDDYLDVSSHLPVLSEVKRK